MIDRFTKEQFEDALPDGWKHAGFDGEHVYYIPVTDRVGVVVRSSIQIDGRAALSGKDSIRIFLSNNTITKPLAKKIDAWTQRTHGWEERMSSKVTELIRKGSMMVNCPKCDTGVLMEREGRYGVFYGCSNYPRCRYTTNDLTAVPKTQKPEPTEDKEPDFGEIFDELAKQTDDEFYFDDDDAFVAPETNDIQLNAQQEAFVTAPIDANMRVMAGPGAGKTASAIRRIEYLIDHGVDPDAIVYVTFTKAMATEGYERLERRIPQVATTRLRQQICTIHALCYRMLRWEGIRRDVPKEWQIKKALNEIIAGDDRRKIDGEWKYAVEKPGYKEVLYWIDNAKRNGLTTTEDFRFFVRHMIHDQAKRVHNARRRFDEWLEEHNYITFADMLYLVEQRLLHDRDFRDKYQGRFTHVIGDEAQDLSHQTLRLLLTLSLEPGDNRVYNLWMRERE